MSGWRVNVYMCQLQAAEYPRTLTDTFNPNPSEHRSTKQITKQINVLVVVIVRLHTNNSLLISTLLGYRVAEHPDITGQSTVTGSPSIAMSKKVITEGMGLWSRSYTNDVYFTMTNQSYEVMCCGGPFIC